MEIINQNIISEFIEWKKVNKDTFTLWNYVNIKTDIQGALGIAGFFLPELLVKDNCVILKDHYYEEIYRDWKEKLSGNKTKIEKIVNSYEVQDFFHIHTDFNDPNINGQIKELSKIIQYFWSINFKNRYPDKNIIVEIFEEYDTTFITVYEDILS